MSSPILNSWKEVARYLGRGVRTVQRWEKELGLPIRRPWNRPHSAVVAIPAEINTWISDTRHVGAAQPPSSHTASNIIASRAKLKSNTAILIDRTHKLENAVARTIALITPLGSREYHLLQSISRR